MRGVQKNHCTCDKYQLQIIHIEANIYSLKCSLILPFKEMVCHVSKIHPKRIL